MAITACVRVSGLKIRNSFDEVWLFLWQHIEACVAITMISLTGFRSVFIADRTQARNNNAKPRYSSTFKKLRSRKTPKSDDYDMEQRFPAIPSATLSGMRTFIQGGKESSPFTLKSKDNISGDWNRLKDVDHIQVSHTLSQSALERGA